MVTVVLALPGTKNTSTGSLGPTLLVLTILELKLMELMELAL